MRKYESIVVFRPELNEAGLRGEIEKIEALLASNGAQNVETNVWGRREVAYLVKKEKFGNFVLFKFEGENPQLVESAQRILAITDSVLKFQTSRCNTKTRKFKGSPRKRGEGEESGDSEY